MAEPPMPSLFNISLRVKAFLITVLIKVFREQT